MTTQAVYRTPDERFEDLPGYGFEPRYLEHLRARLGDGGDAAVRRLERRRNPKGDPELAAHRRHASTVLFDHNEGVLALARARDARIYFSDQDQIFVLTP